MEELTPQEKVKKYTLTRSLIKFYQAELQNFINKPNQNFNLSNLLKNARQTKGLTLERVAKQIGTHPQTLMEVEDANCETSLEEINSIHS